MLHGFCVVGFRFASFRCVFVLSGFASFYVVLVCFVIFLILRFLFFSPSTPSVRCLNPQCDRPLVSCEEQSERVERMGGGHVRHDSRRGAAPAPQVTSPSVVPV